MPVGITWISARPIACRCSKKIAMFLHRQAQPSLILWQQIFYKWLYRTMEMCDFEVCDTVLFFWILAVLFLYFSFFELHRDLQHVILFYFQKLEFGRTQVTTTSFRRALHSVGEAQFAHLLVSHMLSNGSYLLVKQDNKRTKQKNENKHQFLLRQRSV